MKITWLGHAAIRLAFGETVVLIDPFLTGAGRSADELKRWSEGCTHVLLSHGHDDHIGDTVAICRETGAQLVSSFDICQWLAAQGVSTINPGNYGGTVDCGSFLTTFTLAFHSSGTTREGTPVYLGNPMGLVVRPKQGPSVYHMGDTSIFGDMALINELYRPTVGIVPIGDRFTMGPDTAALACRRFFQFETVIPVHYGTFPMLVQTPDTFIEAMGDKGQTVKVLGVGDAIEV
jgi:L-ascorbate metabolism protein UlaG (beta-lactamase superfamily)